MTTPLFIGLDWFETRVKVEPRFVKRQARRCAPSPLCTNEQPPRENVYPQLNYLAWLMSHFRPNAKRIRA